MTRSFVMLLCLTGMVGSHPASAQCIPGYCPGYRGYNLNVTGGFPGAGPYDSAIAIAGIAAGAGLLNTLISQSRPTVVVVPPAYGQMAGPLPDGVTIAPAPMADPSTVVVRTQRRSCWQQYVGRDRYGTPMYVMACD